MADTKVYKSLSLENPYYISNPKEEKIDNFLDVIKFIVSKAISAIKSIFAHVDTSKPGDLETFVDKRFLRISTKEKMGKNKEFDQIVGYETSEGTPSDGFLLLEPFEVTLIDKDKSEVTEILDTVENRYKSHAYQILLSLRQLAEKEEVYDEIKELIEERIKVLAPILPDKSSYVPLVITIAVAIAVKIIQKNLMSPQLATSKLPVFETTLPAVPIIVLPPIIEPVEIVKSVVIAAPQTTSVALKAFGFMNSKMLMSAALIAALYFYNENKKLKSKNNEKQEEINRLRPHEKHLNAIKAIVEQSGLEEDAPTLKTEGGDSAQSKETHERYVQTAKDNSQERYDALKKQHAGYIQTLKVYYQKQLDALEAEKERQPVSSDSQEEQREYQKRVEAVFNQNRILKKQLRQTLLELEDHKFRRLGSGGPIQRKGARREELERKNELLRKENVRLAQQVARLKKSKVED